MFENIVGHDRQKEFLSKSIESGNISHAYLFFGNSGIGKKQVALEFAKYILKTDNLENHPDFRLVSRMEDKKDILVEQIRKDVIDDVYIVPAAGERKVYIIDEAETLNTASQNTLLKTLEEPPQYITIILIASNISTLLTTILSRVNQIPFEGVSNLELKKYIKDNYNTDFNDNIIEYFDGSIGKAIYAIENDLTTKYEKVDKLFGYINAKNTIEAMKYSTEIELDKDELLDYLEYILYKSGKFVCIKIVENAKKRLKFNGNYDIIIDSMLLRLIDNI